MRPFESHLFRDQAKAFLEGPNGEMFRDAFTPQELVKGLVICLEFKGEPQDKVWEACFGSLTKEGRLGTHFHSVVGKLFYHWLNNKLMEEANAHD